MVEGLRGDAHALHVAQVGDDEAVVALALRREACAPLLGAVPPEELGARREQLPRREHAPRCGPELVLRQEHLVLRGHVELGRAPARRLQGEGEAAHDELERAVVREADELLEHLRRGPAVGVDHRHVRAAGALEREVEGLLSRAPSRADELDAQVALGDRLELARHLARADGVHHDELDVRERLVLHALDRTPHRALGAHDDHEHRDRRRCGRVVRHPRSLPSREPRVRAFPQGYQRVGPPGGSLIPLGKMRTVGRPRRARARRGARPPGRAAPAPRRAAPGR